MGLFGLSLDDPLGAKAQKSANRANEARYQQALGMFDAGEPGIFAAFLAQRGALQGAMGATREGTANALRSVSTMGQRGRLGAKDAGSAMLGQQTQGLMRSGLGTSTRMGGLARGVAAQTQRATQSVNEGVAGMQSGLQSQLGGRLANLQVMLGSSFVNQNQALNAWRMGKINTIASKQDVAGPGWLSTAANIAGGFGGAWSGFMGGKDEDK